MTNSTEKMTYVTALNYVLSDEFNLPADVAEKLTKLRDQQVKRNSTERKPTKVQLANEGLKETILDAMSKLGKASTVSDIIVSDPILNGYTTQKISPLLSQLVDAGKVERTIEKRRAYFKVKG